MDYELHYDRLCRRGQRRRKGNGIYYERHHIQPKSLGGSNDKQNLTLLTPREHLIAHKLLYNIHTGPARYKMARALQAMADIDTNGKRVRLDSRTYELIRLTISWGTMGQNSGPQQKASCLKCRRAISARQRESHYRTCYEGLTSRPGDNPGKVRMSCVVCHEEISIGSSNRHYYAKHPKEHAGINYTRNGLPPPTPTVSCVVCHKSMTKQQYGAHSRRHG